MIRIQDLLFVSSLLTISCLANAEGTEKIVGGNLAYAGEFPGYAIPSGSKIFCGAYLINENTLVTAAHCAGAFKGYNVKIGGTLRSGADAVETIPAIQECVHPQFNSTTHQNDIMLIKLQSPSNQPFKEFYTVCHKMQSFMRRSNEDFMDWCSYISWDYRQSSSFLENGQAVQTVGFGATSYKGALSDDLLKVDMNIISYGTCSNTYWNGLYNKVMVCAGGEGKDTCQGDSGGEYTYNTLYR
jgi:secreted trypsin-like serine protease